MLFVFQPTPQVVVENDDLIPALSDDGVRILLALLANGQLACPFPKQALVFTCLKYKPLENTVGKGEIARNEQFLLFPPCFLPIWRTFCHLY